MESVKTQAQAQNERPFQAGVQIQKPRKLSPEFGCAAFLYFSVAAQLVLAVIILASKNTEIPNVDGCPSGYWPANECSGEGGGPGLVVRHGGLCLSRDLCQDVFECSRDAPPFDRLLSSADSTSRRLSSSIPRDSWQFLEEHWYQPTVLFLMSFVLASLWLYALQKITKVVVWGTIVADTLLLIGVFVWFLAEGWGVNWPCIVGAVAIVGASAIWRKKVSAAADMMNIAMNGLFANKRVFGVCFGVQMVWVGFFALWIASLMGMHFIKEVRQITNEEIGVYTCELVTPSWIDGGALMAFWLFHYYWVTFFFQNVNTIVITHTVAGWYFNEDGYKHFWLSALKWSGGPLAGGNAICAAIMGIGEYCMSKIGSAWSLCFAILNPFDWFFVLLAFCFKTLVQTYTKFGLIAHAYSGRPLCETAPRAFQVLKQWLGEAVITDYLGKRIMAWCTYMVALLVTYIAWVWGCQAQNLTGAELELPQFLVLVFFWVYLLSYPFLGLMVMVLVEQYAGSSIDGELRGYMNAFFASLFMGCITYFVLNFLSQVVVNAMDVALFCYAVEKDLGEQQNERFATLYDSIKMTVTTGVAQGSSEVVVGTAAPSQTFQVTVPEGVLPGQQLQVSTPSGQQVTVTVPEGLQPGMQFTAMVPGGITPATVAPAPTTAVVGQPVNNETNEAKEQV
jgi:hypothetical protein